MSKESDLQKRIHDLEEDNKHFKNWKSKCDRAALKWGSFAMGVLTLGALMVAGMDKITEKVSTILTIWASK